jgi:hypothetical protein
MSSSRDGLDGLGRHALHEQPSTLSWRLDLTKWLFFGRLGLGAEGKCREQTLNLMIPALQEHEQCIVFMFVSFLTQARYGARVYRRARESNSTIFFWDGRHGFKIKLGP